MFCAKLHRHIYFSIFVKQNCNRMGKRKYYNAGIRISWGYLPEDIQAIIISEQEKKKEECKCCYSKEQTIYMLLRRLYAAEK